MHRYKCYFSQSIEKEKSLILLPCSIYTSFLFMYSLPPSLRPKMYACHSIERRRQRSNLEQPLCLVKPQHFFLERFVKLNIISMNETSLVISR